MKTTIKAFDDLTAMMVEPLHEDLEPFVRDSKVIGNMIHHPLCVSIAFVPGMANRQYANALERLARAEKNQKWHSYVFVHERPYRVTALMDLVERDVLTSTQYGDIASAVWIDSENHHEYIPEWEQVFDDTNGADWMDEDDQKELNALPASIEIWRGECDDTGRSWTLDPKIANFFANRGMNKSDGEVCHGYVDKENVFAYLTGRGESEILVNDRGFVDESV